MNETLTGTTKLGQNVPRSISNELVFHLLDIPNWSLTI